MPQVTRISLFPIKSLDGFEAEAARILPSGAIENDRRFALQDSQGKYINGKRVAAIHCVRAQFDPASLEVTLSAERAESEKFSLPENSNGLSDWATQVLEQPCQLVENATAGMPDDTDAPGPTLISTQSLEEIADWFDVPLDECRRRLRTNVEIDAPEPFWEDRLVGQQFSVGAVPFFATGVCQRCVVPTRDSRTGEATAGFQKSFAQQREASLPAESPRAAFNHFYRAAINTRLAGSPGILSLGDELAHAS